MNEIAIIIVVIERNTFVFLSLVISLQFKSETPLSRSILDGVSIHI